jgi:hypothetical protein
MPLVRLIYASRSNRTFDQSELAELARRSGERNGQNGVTGSLIYCDGFFLQWLEGEEPAVRKTFGRIATDPRHRDVHELSCLPANARVFGQWGMSMLHENTAMPPDLKRIRSMTSRLQSVACWDEMGRGAAELVQALRAAIERQTQAAPGAKAA